MCFFKLINNNTCIVFQVFFVIDIEKLFVHDVEDTIFGTLFIIV